MQFLYQAIPSCSIWYCLSNPHTDGTRASNIDYAVLLMYGKIQYNHRLNYENTETAISNGTEGNLNNYTNSINWKFDNFHNATPLFRNTNSTLI